MGNNTKNIKSTGYVLWSQKTQVKSEQQAWSDVVTYAVPVVGTYDRNKIWSALNAKFAHPGSIIGSSYGNCSVSLGDYNETTHMLTVSLSYGIGE